MKITKHCDWYGVTFPVGTKPQDVLPDGSWAYTGKGKHGYSKAFEERITGARFESDGTEEMGAHLTLSGSSLSEIRRSTGKSDNDIIRHCYTLRGRASRLDLCVNIHAGELTPASFMKAFKKGSIKTPARSANITSGVKDNVDGETLYLGSRQSERYIRIYDKAAEQNVVDAGAWLRLEMEVKGMSARAAADACKTSPIADVVNSAFENYLQWDDVEYKMAISGSGAEIAEVGRTDTNRRKWLLEVVAKSLARQLFIEPDFGMKFRQYVEFHLDQIELDDLNHGYDKA